MARSDPSNVGHLRMMEATIGRTRPSSVIKQAKVSSIASRSQQSHVNYANDATGMVDGALPGGDIDILLALQDTVVAVATVSKHVKAKDIKVTKVFRALLALSVLHTGSIALAGNKDANSNIAHVDIVNTTGNTAVGRAEDSGTATAATAKRTAIRYENISTMTIVEAQATPRLTRDNARREEERRGMAEEKTDDLKYLTQYLT
ncbi:hypothetical protein N7470_000741 [Penicillium chermesinum]|nr:hypothetical protein N7470_000741 [Penicillium chermesinum]